MQPKEVEMRNLVASNPKLLQIFESVEGVKRNTEATKRKRDMLKSSAYEETERELQRYLCFYFKSLCLFEKNCC